MTYVLYILKYINLKNKISSIITRVRTYLPTERSRNLLCRQSKVEICFADSVEVTLIGSQFWPPPPDGAKCIIDKYKVAWRGVDFV